MVNMAVWLGEADPISKTRGDHHPALSVNNDSPQAESLHEGHSFLRAHHEDPCRQAVGHGGVGSNDGDALAAAGRLQRPGIEDVVIADTVFKEETFVIAGRRYGFIDGFQCRKYRPAAPGMLDADRPGSAIGTPPEDPKVSSGGDQVLIVTRDGKGSRFSEKEVRPMGRDTMGVSAIRLRKGDEVAGFDIVKPNGYVLVVTQQGFGKLTPMSDYPVKSRNIQGVYTVDQNAIPRIGQIVGMRIVEDLSEELMVISTMGQVIRIPLEQVRISGRQTRGVIIMRMAEGDMIGSIAGVGTAESFEP